MGGPDRGTRGTGREGKFGVYVEMDMKAVEPSTFDFKRLVYRQMIESIKWDICYKCYILFSHENKLKYGGFSLSRVGKM